MKCVSLKGETSARNQLGSLGSLVLLAPPVSDLIRHRRVSDSDSDSEQPQKVSDYGNGQLSVWVSICVYVRVCVCAGHWHGEQEPSVS